MPRTRSALRPYPKPRTLAVARDLLGKTIIRKIGGKRYSMLITETEAYIGEKDLASHARFGKTARNAVMYGHPGVWYVYLVYGMHWMLNLVTEEHGKPGAVLIRAGIAENGKKLSGPGLVAKYLKVNKNFYGESVYSGALRISNKGIKPKKIKKMPRVGIDYAKEYKHKLWRFVLIQGE